MISGQQISKDESSPDPAEEPSAIKLGPSQVGAVAVGTSVGVEVLGE